MILYAQYEQISENVTKRLFWNYWRSIFQVSKFHIHSNLCTALYMVILAPLLKQKDFSRMVSLREFRREFKKQQSYYGYFMIFFVVVYRFQVIDWWTEEYNSSTYGNKIFKHMFSWIQFQRSMAFLWIYLIRLTLFMMIDNLRILKEKI